MNGRLSFPVEQKDMAVPSVPDIKSYKVKCRFIFHFKAKMWLVSFFDTNHIHPTLHSAKHPPYHLIPLGYRMPVHPGPIRDGTVIGLSGMKFHVHPDLPLLFGKRFRRRDPLHLVQEQLSLCLHLLDELFQLLLTSSRVVAYTFFACRFPSGHTGEYRPSKRWSLISVMHPVPDRRICPPTGWKSVICGGSGWETFSCTSYPSPRSILAAASACHVLRDVGVDVQCGGRRYMAQHRRKGFDIHTVLQCQGGKGVPKSWKLNQLLCWHYFVIY